MYTWQSYIVIMMAQQGGQQTNNRWKKWALLTKPKAIMLLNLATYVRSYYSFQKYDVLFSKRILYFLKFLTPELILYLFLNYSYCVAI